MTNLTGQSIGRYQILEPLGEGGMAIVYKAFDPRLERFVAVKIIRTEKVPLESISRALKRFEREARALARLDHPNIVRVIDFGEHEGKPYLVMDYVTGGSLKQRLTDQPLPFAEAVRLLLPIAQALEYAHGQGILHRDVKPGNILIDAKGNPILSDFGVAKLLEAEETLDLTGSSLGVGTPAYMAPEQFQGRTLDARADVYALGVVFYELVTGRKPYIGNTPGEVLWKQASEALSGPRKFNSGLPVRVEKVILKALAKKPEDRYPDAAHFAAALEALALAKPAPKVIQSEKRRSPFPWKLAVGGLAGLLVLIAGAWLSQNDFPAVKPAPATLSLVASATAQNAPVVEQPGPTNLPQFSETLLSSFTPAATDTPQSTQMPQASSTPEVAVIPTLGIGSAQTREKDGMVMVYVPEGPFTMGNDAGSDNEKPAHTVILNAFWIDQTEVTNSMYAVCVHAGICQSPRQNNSRIRSNYYTETQYADYPVIYVDWNQAKTYCEWAGGRLPTEAEWEKAARGPSSSSGAVRTYPWGDDIDKTYANYNQTIGDTTRVGSYESGKSLYGAYDLAGNVWEWVSDWYGGTYYQSSPANNPTGPASGTVRVLRGGAWNVDNRYVRSAYRYWYVPSITYNYVGFGFRCVRPR